MNTLLRTVGLLLILGLGGAGCTSTGNVGAAQDKPLEAPIPELSPDQALKAADANLRVAAAYMSQNDMENTNRKLQRALKIAPEYYATHLMLGRFYDRIQEPKSAERHFKHALKLRPDEPQTLDNYAQFLCSTGRQEEAQQYFIKAATNPRYETPDISYTNLSTCLLSVDRKEDALGYLLKALQINPQLARALLHVAAIKMDQEDPTTARAYMKRYEQAAQHTPSSLWLAAQIERRLQNRDAAAGYEMALRNLYPDSLEAHNLLRAPTP